MVDSPLTNPRPDLRLDPAYIRARIVAAYWYIGETPNADDLAYWSGHTLENGDGWSGYWWDKIVGEKPVVHAEAIPYMVDHTDVVAAVKAQLVARGVDLSGDCGAFEITKRVAWQLRGEGIGLLSKPSGANCQGYAAGYLVYPGNVGVDMLQDAGGINGPAWQVDGVDESLNGRWRAPFDPGDVVAPATPPLNSQFEPQVLQRLAAIDAKLDALRVQADANTEKIQQQLNQIVKDAESTGKTIGGIVEPLIPGLLGLLGRK